MTFLHSPTLPLRHLGFPASPLPDSGHPLYLLESCPSINPKDPPSFKKSLDYPQEGHVLSPPSALKAGTSLPFSLWGYFVKTQDLSAQLGHKLPGEATSSASK